jgi:hypothetical protein
MNVERHVVNIVTDAAGAATAYTTNAISGRIAGIAYIPDGATPFDNTVDFTITVESTGEAILSKSNVAAAFAAYPRVPTHDTSGAAALYAAGGAAVLDGILVSKDRVKIVVAQGGNVKSGQIAIIVA